MRQLALATVARPTRRSANEERPPSRGIVALTAMGGSALVMAGAVLPWLSVYAGLKSYAGVTGLYGRLLLAGGMLGLLGGVCYLAVGGRALHWALGLWGFVLLALAGWLVVQLLETYRHLAVDPLLFARIGPGLFVAAAGAAALAATLLLSGSPHTTTPPGGQAADRPVATVISASLALLSAGAATVHFAVLGPHLRESPLLGGLFAAAAVAQMAWALLVWMRPSRRLYLAGAIGNVVVILVWAGSRTVGVPFAAGGGPEPVGFADALSSAYEILIVVGVILALLRPASGRELRTWWARGLTWALGAIVALLTGLAVLSAGQVLS